MPNPATLAVAIVLSAPGAPLSAPPQAAPAAAPTAVGAQPAVDPQPTTAGSPAPAPAENPAASATPPAASPPPPAAMRPPPAPNTPPRAKLPPKGTTLLIVGASVAAGTYMFTALAGAIAVDKARDKAVSDNPLTETNEAAATDRDRRRGAAMMIPLAGPFMAMRHTSSMTRKYGLAVNGTLQAAGIVLAIVGAVQHGRYRQAKRWSLAAAPSPSGGQLSLHVRF